MPALPTAVAVAHSHRPTFTPLGYRVARQNRSPSVSTWMSNPASANNSTMRLGGRGWSTIVNRRPSLSVRSSSSVGGSVVAALSTQQTTPPGRNASATVRMNRSMRASGTLQSQKPKTHASHSRSGCQSNRSTTSYATLVAAAPRRARFLSSISGLPSRTVKDRARRTSLSVHTPVPAASSTMSPSNDTSSNALCETGHLVVPTRVACRTSIVQSLAQVRVVVLSRSQRVVPKLFA